MNLYRRLDQVERMTEERQIKEEIAVAAEAFGLPADEIEAEVRRLLPRLRQRQRALGDAHAAMGQLAEDEGIDPRDLLAYLKEHDR